ncbi:MAG: oxidoreductase [Oscillospiraceae bacterium]|nr:oxidoreductase [Oscillospiraceae bacterium]
MNNIAPRYALLVDQEYCTGCQSCAIACQQEHQYPAGKSGVRVTEHIYPGNDDKPQIDFEPFFTVICDLCAERRAKGTDTVPACVRNCQAKCIEFGDAEKLIKSAACMKRPALYLK